MIRNDGVQILIRQRIIRLSGRLKEVRSVNVLYLNTHDIGRYLESYGYPVKTPNLLQLSRDGMTFSQMYCASPTCSPSRGVLLTGQYAHANGLIGLSHRGFQINGRHHLANYLREHGYETVLSGVQHEIILHRENEIGYDLCLNSQEYYRNDMAKCDLYTWQDEQAVSYLRNYKRDGKPFYLAVGFGSTHRDYPRVPKDYEVDYVQVPKPIPNLPETRQDMAGMLISLEKIDSLCGNIIRTLKEIGQYENTLILFTTDHGLPFPMMKCKLYDDGTGVSFLLRYPGMKNKHGFSDALLSQVDVFPTICEILGLEKPDWLQGKSFLSVIEGISKEIRDEVFGEVNYHVAYEPQRSVRTKHYKYIVKGDNDYRQSPPCHVDDSLTKEVFHRAGYFENAVPEEELYDLMLDPQERCNLAANPDYCRVLDDMKRRLNLWQQETEDPLLTGRRISLPEGAICSTTDSYGLNEQVILPECRNALEHLRGVLQNTIR